MKYQFETSDKLIAVSILDISTHTKKSNIQFIFHAYFSLTGIGFTQSLYFKYGDLDEKSQQRIIKHIDKKKMADDILEKINDTVNYSDEFRNKYKLAWNHFYDEIPESQQLLFALEGLGRFNDV